jgi:phosphohistidine swiveling domain-containing protein
LQSEIKKRLVLPKSQTEQLFAKLCQGLEGSAVTKVNIQISEFDCRQEALNFAYQHIGHFSTGEMLEIRQPRLKDDPAALSAYVDGIRQSRYKEAFEKQKNERLETQERLLEKLPLEEREEMEKIIYAAQEYMALRETVKYLFTQEYSRLRDALELLENKLGLEKGDIYHLYPRELPELVDDLHSMIHILHSRRQAFTNYQDLNLPRVIRESDLENLSLRLDISQDFTELKGNLLAEGQPVEGVVVNLDEFETLSGVKTRMNQYQKQNIPVILVATQMNLGHDPFIALASGLVLANAGIVSHGAQRARELGKGAIGGIDSRRLKTGTRIYFNPIKRLIRKIEKDETN